jgi:Protein of unknown function (DUF3467)
MRTLTQRTIISNGPNNQSREGRQRVENGQSLFFTDLTGAFPMALDPQVPSDGAAAASVAAPQAVEVEGLQPLYANFCRVGHTPEELILDFGLNPSPVGPSTIPVKITQRMVLTYYTAKRLAGILGRAIQLHEQTFGPLEMDLNKRVLPTAPRTPKS